MRAVSPEYQLYSNPSSSLNSPEMFDYPGLAAQLYTIAQAVHFPAEYMVHVLQIAELGQWKDIQDNNGTLSYRELARRGKDIERVLLGQLMPPSGYVKKQRQRCLFQLTLLDQFHLPQCISYGVHRTS
jgi:hypothetical protein